MNAPRTKTPTIRRWSSFGEIWTGRGFAQPLSCSFLPYLLQLQQSNILGQQIQFKPRDSESTKTGRGRSRRVRRGNIRTVRRPREAWRESIAEEAAIFERRWSAPPSAGQLWFFRCCSSLYDHRKQTHYFAHSFFTYCFPPSLSFFDQVRPPCFQRWSIQSFQNPNCSMSSFQDTCKKHHVFCQCKCYVLSWENLIRSYLIIIWG